MKKTLLSIVSIGAFVAVSTAQTYTPAAGTPLASGELGATYNQTINADIPTTAELTGQQILDLLPSAVQAIAGAAINGSTTYPITVASTVLTVAGLPSGISSDCNGCTVNAGGDRDIVLSGTPSAAGVFTVNITSETAGETTIQGFTLPFGGTFDPGIGFPIPIPTIPGVMDAEGYTMNIVDPNGIEEANAVFSMSFYPNPTVGNSTLEVKSTVAGIASVEVYSITGALVQANSTSVRLGTNRINIDLSAMPAGIYMIKAAINGNQALIRTQKI
ncbi:MAG: Secretion system C-terminal sorting domain [Bacteroidota bacterium]